MEFFGPGAALLSIADRASISNMCPEYGATVGFFPVDDMSIQYLKQSGTCSLYNKSFCHFEGYISVPVVASVLAEAISIEKSNNIPDLNFF